MAIRKEFWRLAWPAAAEGLLLMLLTAADLLMVSALGNTAVAAVSIFSQPRMVILCVTRSYSVALSAYVARRRGKHPDESLTSCSRASLMLGCGLSMLLLVGTWIGAGPLLRLAGAQDDYINLGLQYAFPTLVSLALSGPAIVLHGILAGLGDTKSVLVSNVLILSVRRLWQRHDHIGLLYRGHGDGGAISGTGWYGRFSCCRSDLEHHLQPGPVNGDWRLRYL